MDKHRLGIVCITGSDGALQGIITDGDIRRMLSNVQKPLAALMSDDVIVHAIKSPTTVTASTSLQNAIDIMGKKQDRHAPSHFPYYGKDDNSEIFQLHLGIN